ncbi:hypothetical protein F4861DRAFT_543184 [Xylaria intraflava]|nr:hypothetical protein F4861DRAFT_543184 [Xylaria intraflava]
MSDAMAQMEADLGNVRIEELAQDVQEFGTILANTQLPRLRGGSAFVRNNDVSQRWKVAVESNLFDDDDAAGVKGLDPLDGGGAHRVNNGQVGNVLPQVIRPRYNPSCPVYRHGTSRQTENCRPNVSNAAHKMSSLGGIIPDGGTIKRWQSSKVTSQTYSVDNLMSAPLTHIQGNSSGNSIQATSNRHEREALAPERFITKTGQQNGQRDRLQPSATLESHITVTHALSQLGHAEPKAHGSATPSDQEIFLKEDILVKDEAGTGKVPGQIIIYRTDLPVLCICELTINNEKVITADIRSLLRLLVDGSRVMFRRNGPNGEGLLINTLYFENIAKATIFQEVVERLKPLYQSLPADTGVEKSVNCLPVQGSTTQQVIAKPAGSAKQQSGLPTFQPPEAIAQEAIIKPADTKSQQLESHINKPPQEKSKPAGAATEIDQTLPPVLPPHLRGIRSDSKTTAGADGDMIVFSPPNQDDKVERPNDERLTASNNGANEQEATDTKKAEESTAAAEDLQVINGTRTGKNLSQDSCRLLYGITSAGYGQVIRMSEILAVELKDSSISAHTYLASIFHLMQRTEFLDLPWDQKKKCIGVVYANAHQRDSRIIRSPEEMIALRSAEGGARLGPFLYRLSGGDLQPQKTSQAPTVSRGRGYLDPTSPAFNMPPRRMNTQRQAPPAATTPRTQTPTETAKTSGGLSRSHWAD